MRTPTACWSAPQRADRREEALICSYVIPPEAPPTLLPRTDTVARPMVATDPARTVAPRPAR